MNVPSDQVRKMIVKIEKTNQLAHIGIMVPITHRGIAATRDARASPSWLNDDLESFLRLRGFKMKSTVSTCGFERLIVVSSGLELPDL